MSVKFMENIRMYLHAYFPPPPESWWLRTFQQVVNGMRCSIPSVPREELGPLGVGVESPSPPRPASSTRNVWVERPRPPGGDPEAGPCLACYRDSERGDEVGKVADGAGVGAGPPPEFVD